MLDWSQENGEIETERDLTLLCLLLSKSNLDSVIWFTYFLLHNCTIIIIFLQNWRGKSVNLDSHNKGVYDPNHSDD